MKLKYIIIAFFLIPLTPLILGLAVLVVSYFVLETIYNFYDRFLEHLENRKKYNLKYKAHVKTSVFFNDKKG